MNEFQSLRDVRHIDKTFYLGADRRFYEPNYVHHEPSDELLRIAQDAISPLESEWEIRRADVWTHVMPLRDASGPQLLKQGWKIHVSATNVNCMEILEIVASLAVNERIQFKFANDVETLRLMTSKRWTRGGSGKFVTIYPSSDDEFRAFIETAYTRLRGFEGSYILSDRRYKDSRCLYYRYGTIQSTAELDHLGRRLETLTSPEGERTVDLRTPYYDLPAWLPEIFSSEAETDGGEDGTLGGGRFAVRKALAFSNTGGVYLARDTSTGGDVVIKEARPFVELGDKGEDATTRLQREAAILEAIGGTGVVPRLLTTFWDWENFYLVEEFLEAEDMRGLMLAHSPLLRSSPTLQESEAFYAIFRSMFVSLLGAVDRIHSAGVVIGDLSPTNILVEEPSYTVRIIDLEGAFRPAVDAAQDIHTPGFRPHTADRKKESNFADDLYAVGVIMMYSMFPVAAMAYVRNDVFANVLPVLIDDLGWSATPALEVIRGLIANSMTCSEAIRLLHADCRIGQPLAASPRSEASGLDAMQDGLARFIAANHRSDPRYTLFPIDPFGRHSNPSGFAFGSTGIVYALKKCGRDVPKDAMDEYRRAISAIGPQDLPPGFLIGTAGMGWALLACGETEGGRRLIDCANSSNLRRNHHSLYYGMAGIGMANLAAWRALGEPKYLTEASDLAEKLNATAIRDDRGVHWENGDGVHIGFGYGQSGVALFLLRLSQASGEPLWRQRGLEALEYDLSFGVEIEPGVTSFGESPTSTRTFEQYIEQGSGGIAKVAMRYGLWDRLDGMLRDVSRKYSCFAGLLYGLSGFVDVLTDAYVHSGDVEYLVRAERPLQGIRDLYLFETNDGVAAPGENLFRISCDYATGLSGILLTLRRFDRRLGDEFCLDALDPSRSDATGR